MEERRGNGRMGMDEEKNITPTVSSTSQFVAAHAMPCIYTLQNK